MSEEREEDVWEHGLYRDRTNGDLWRLDIIIAPDGVTRIERWQWINGNRWNHVPRESLEKLPDGLTQAMLT